MVQYRQVVLSSQLSAGNTSFYLGFRSVRSMLLITVIRAAAINNVLALPVNVRSIWSQASSLDTENHPRTLLYQIETCRD